MSGETESNSDNPYKVLMRNFSNYKSGIFFVVAALFFLAWFSLWTRGNRSPWLTQATASGNETERLFESMGILNLHAINPPVEIDLEDLNGAKVRLADLRGKIVLVNFWTTWCPDCRVEMPSLEKLHRHFRDRQFILVAVNLKESAAAVKKYVKTNNLSFMNLLDIEGRIGLSFGVRAIPATFILDKKGALIGKVFGPREWDSKKSFNLFEHLIGTPANDD